MHWSESDWGPAGVLSSVQIARNETFIFLEKLKPALHHLQGGNKQYMREAFSLNRHVDLNVNAWVGQQI